MTAIELFRKYIAQGYDAYTASALANANAAK